MAFFDEKNQPYYPNISFLIRVAFEQDILSSNILNRKRSIISFIVQIIAIFCSMDRQLNEIGTIPVTTSIIEMLYQKLKSADKKVISKNRFDVVYQFHIVAIGN